MSHGSNPPLSSSQRRERAPDFAIATSVYPRYSAVNYRDARDNSRASSQFAAFHFSITGLSFSMIVSEFPASLTCRGVA